MALGDLIPWNRLRAPVTHRESMSPLVAFQDQVNRLLDDFWRGVDGTDPLVGASFGYPRVEMSESAAELKVEAELPGLEEKDVELLLRDGELIIRGERQSEKEDQERRMSERQRQTNGESVLMRERPPLSHLRLPEPGLPDPRAHRLDPRRA